MRYLCKHELKVTETTNQVDQDNNIETTGWLSKMAILSCTNSTKNSLWMAVDSVFKILKKGGLDLMPPHQIPIEMAIKFNSSLTPHFLRQLSTFLFIFFLLFSFSSSSSSSFSFFLFLSYAIFRNVKKWLSRIPHRGRKRSFQSRFKGPIVNFLVAKSRVSVLRPTNISFSFFFFFFLSSFLFLFTFFLFISSFLSNILSILFFWRWGGYLLREREKSFLLTEEVLDVALLLLYGSNWIGLHTSRLNEFSGVKKKINTHR